MLHLLRLLPSLRYTFISVFVLLLMGGCAEQHRRKTPAIEIKQKAVIPEPITMTTLIIEIETIGAQSLPIDTVFLVSLQETPELGFVAKTIASQESIINESGDYAMALTFADNAIIEGKQYQVTLEFKQDDDIVFRQYEPLVDSFAASNDNISKVVDLHLLTAEQDKSKINNTLWALTTLGDKKITPHTEREALYIQLQRDTNKIVGFSGCNRFTGQYRLLRTKINFEQLQSTRKMCIESMMIERLFLSVLTQTDRYSIKPEQLTFMDGEGTMLAQFALINRDLH